MFSEHQFKLGATFALVGEYEQAYVFLKKLYKLGFDGDGPFYYWLTYAAYFTGHEHFARNVWKKVLELNRDKEGFEPWNEDKPSNIGYEDHSGTIFQKIVSDYIEERLFGLFLLSVSAVNTSLLTSKRIVKNEKLTVMEQQYLSFLNTGKRTSISDAHEIAVQLYEFYQPVGTVEAGLYLFWFSVFTEINAQGVQLKNKRAWAAAIDYVWNKSRSQKLSQQDVAERYGLSNATVGKYVKWVNSLLDQ
jgi:hypothetical protein